MPNHRTTDAPNPGAKRRRPTRPTRRRDSMHQRTPAWRRATPQAVDVDSQGFARAHGGWQVSTCLGTNRKHGHPSYRLCKTYPVHPPSLHHTRHHNSKSYFDFDPFSGDTRGEKAKTTREFFEFKTSRSVLPDSDRLARLQLFPNAEGIWICSL